MLASGLVVVEAVLADELVEAAAWTFEHGALTTLAPTVRTTALVEAVVRGVMRRVTMLAGDDPTEPVITARAIALAVQVM